MIRQGATKVRDWRYVMATRTREQFAPQINSEILSAICDLAQDEGRQMQALVNEALADP